MKTVALALVSMLIVVVPLPIDAQRLVPKNEVARAPGFEAFLVHLREAVERRDADFIAALVPETMRAGWDDEGGPAAFRRRYKLADRPAARGRGASRLSRITS